MHDHGGQISSASGFYYEHHGLRYLVTNWHVITGRDFFNNSILDKKYARIPLWLEVETATWISSEGHFVLLPSRIELFDDIDVPFERRWLEHPSVRVDVVAILSPKPGCEPEFMHYAVNKIGKYRIPVRPGMTSFVVGFPHGLKVGFGLPIWKSTFIASEPYYDASVGDQRVKAFFLDGRTRPGMSGSPVFAQFIGNWDLKDPYMELDYDAPDFWTRDDVVLNHTAMEFIGVYSGRLGGGHEEDAALGLCWKKEVIDEICAQQQ
jgi:hypothetical protein